LDEVFTCRVRIENFWRLFWEWGREMSTPDPSCGQGPYPVHRSVSISDNCDSFEKETRTLRCHPCQGRNFFEWRQCPHTLQGLKLQRNSNPDLWETKMGDKILTVVENSTSMWVAEVGGESLIHSSIDCNKCIHRERTRQPRKVAKKSDPKWWFWLEMNNYHQILYIFRGFLKF
jgi:hypothetical protein